MTPDRTDPDDLDVRWKAALLERAAKDFPHLDLEAHLAIAEEYEKASWAASLRLSMAWAEFKAALREAVPKWLRK